jgi:hypothetical protein
MKVLAVSLGSLLLVEPGIVWSEEAEDNVAPDISIVLPDRLHLASGRALSWKWSPKAASRQTM